MTVTTAAGLLVDFMPGAGPFDVAGDFYLDINGATGARATTPDDAALDILGDIEVRVDATLVSWVSPLTSGMELFGKFVPPSNQSWLLWINSDRRLVLRHSADGTAAIDNVCSERLPILSGRLAVAAILDVDNGAGGHTVFFRTAPTIAGPWTLLGTSVTSGATSIFNSTATVGVGDVPSSGFSLPTGRFHAAQIINSSSVTVANPDFTAQQPGTTSFADAAGRTWTVNSPATITGFDWVDLSDRLVGDTRWTIGRTSELDQFPPGTAELTLKNDDRELDPEYTAGTWYGLLNPRTPFRIRSTTSGLSLPGSASANATTPDHASLVITDLDVRVRLAMTDWTPGGLGQFITGQWPASAGNDGWLLSMNTSGQPVLTWTANGTTQLTRTCSAATGLTDGAETWLRCTLDVDNGAAGHTVVWYTSTDGVTWTQLGTTSTTAGTTSIFNSTADLSIGQVLALAGTVKQLELRSSIGGTVVANPDFSAQRPGATSFKDRTGKTWTVNGTAAVVNDTAHPQDEFYGFVEDGFQQLYRPPDSGDCEIRLTDMLGVLNGAPLDRSAYAAEVLFDQPAAYWRLDERSGVQMSDSSGNGRHGQYDNSELGQEPLIAGDGSAVEFLHVGDHRGEWKGEGLPVAAPCSLEAWVKTDRDAAAIKTILAAHRDYSLGSALALQIHTSGTGSPDGELVIDFFGLGSFYKARGHTRIDDNERHHVVCTIAGNTPSDVQLYVDGVLQTKTTVAGTNPGPWPSHLIWTVGNTTNNGYGDYGFDGVVDEAAVYPITLMADRILAHYSAGANGFDGEATGDRIERVLDLVGVPDALRDISTGDTFAGPADYSGQSAGAYIASVVESEQGYFHVDHRHGGKLKFRGRYHRLTETRSTTSLVTYTDDDGVGNLHYERDGFDVDPNSIGSIVNVVDIEWRGGTETVQDTASRAAYGPQGRTLRTDAPTPSSAQSAGLWLVNRYSQPRARVRSFKLRPDADRRLWPAVLDREIHDRVTVVRHPQQVGTATSNDLIVEGLTHNVAGTRWATTVRTSGASSGVVWIWDVSTWGETTAWG